MKKLMILGVAALALASCKKDYTCECQNTSLYNGATEYVDMSTVTLEGVSKRTVSNSQDCVSYESTSVDSDGDVYTYNVECTVSKL